MVGSSHEHVPLRIETQGIRKDDAGVKGKLPVHRVRCGSYITVSCERADISRQIDLANSRITIVGNVKTAIRIESKPTWRIEFGTGCRPTITAKAWCTYSCKGRDIVSRMVYSFDLIIGHIGEEDISIAVYCNSGWSTEFSGYRRTPFTAIAKLAVSCNRRNKSGRCINSPDPAICIFTEDNVATTIHGYP